MDDVLVVIERPSEGYQDIRANYDRHYFNYDRELVLPFSTLLEAETNLNKLLNEGYEAFLAN